MKKTLKVALYILLALVLIVLAYVIYVFAAYYRVEDWQTLSVVHCDAASASTDGGRTADRRHLAAFSSANVGFGAYSDVTASSWTAARRAAPAAGRLSTRICAARSRSSKTFRRLRPLSGGRHRRHAQLAHRRGRLSQ